MSYDFTLDIDALLAPISESLPCGEARETSSNVELSRAFSVVLSEWQAAKKMEKEAVENKLMFVGRSESSTTKEATAVSEKAIPFAQWKPIAEKAIQFLKVYSKDARILACLMEAMTRLNGFNGLLQSLNLLRQTLERYAGQLNPRPEASEEAAPFDSISTNLSSKTFFDAIRKAPISKQYECRMVNFFDQELAMHFEATDLDEKLRKELIEKGQLTTSLISQTFQKVPKEDLLATEKEIEDAIAEAKLIDTLLRQHKPETASADVSISGTISLLEDIQKWFKQFAAAKLKDSTKSPDATKEGTANTTNAVAVGGAQPTTVTILEGQLQNREQAFEQLLKVAEYFRKTEPHSPISYSLEQAVRWGRMPLPQFLEEVLRNDEALSEVYRRIGYRPKTDNQ